MNQDYHEKRENWRFHSSRILWYLTTAIAAHAFIYSGNIWREKQSTLTLIFLLGIITFCLFGALKDRWYAERFIDKSIDTYIGVPRWTFPGSTFWSMIIALTFLGFLDVFIIKKINLSLLWSRIVLILLILGFFSAYACIRKKMLWWECLIIAIIVVILLILVIPKELWWLGWPIGLFIISIIFKFTGLWKAKKRRGEMAYYMFQAAYTSGALASLVKNPQDREQAARTVIENLGGKLVGMWLTFGDYDMVGIAELPDNVSAVALSMAVASGGAVKAFKTTPLLTTAEGVEGMRRASGAGYQPP